MKSANLAAKASSKKSDDILLSTIPIKVLTMDRHELQCRAILDSGSQLNIITDQLVKQLGLKELPDELCIQGIGQATQRSQSKGNFPIPSRTTGFPARIETFVLPQITTHKPAEFIDIL